MSSRAGAICEGLLNAPMRPASSLAATTVPSCKGVYVWRQISDGEAVYVGSATGEEGLWKRIIRQHLNPKYRMPDGKEKSVFRKAVAADIGARPGEQCVDFIRERFCVAWLACPGDAREVIHEAEAVMIRQCQPRYNKQGK